MNNKVSKFLPGKVWNDTSGMPIQAHGGGVLYHGGKYYWYGEDKSGETISGDHIICGYRMDAIGVRCYESNDLYNWKDCGLVLPAVKDNPVHDLYVGNVLERPKVIYHEKSGKFVMWLHVDKPDYTYARAGVAVSDSPTGPFIYLGSVNPNESDCRDMTLYKDTDGKAYLIHSSEWNKTLYISELDESYLGFTGRFTRNFVDCSREAPAIFKGKNQYYMITSGCTGWAPNEALYAVSDEVMGNWEMKTNPCRGEEADKTFYAQSTYVLKVESLEDVYIMMFDRWKKENLRESTYCWLPIRYEKGVVVIEWYDHWNLEEKDV